MVIVQAKVYRMNLKSMAGAGERMENNEKKALKRMLIDRFLPFGLRTSPFLFDLFAKGIHCIMAALLSWGLIFHYLDDFFWSLRGTATSRAIW